MILLSQHFCTICRKGARARDDTCLSVGGRALAECFLTRRTSNGGNLWASVLVSWMLAQVGRPKIYLQLRLFFRPFH